MNKNEVPNLTKRLGPLLQRTYPKVSPLLASVMQSSGGETSDTVRKRINAVGRQYLGSMAVDTIDMRIMLDDFDNMEYWYMNFTTKVLPFWERNS